MTIYIGGLTGLTWEAARGKVRGDLWRPGSSLSDDVVNRALHASVLELESEQTWLWLEEVAAAVILDEPLAFFDLPTAIGRVSSVSVRNNGSLDRLNRITVAPVREAAEGIASTPSWWALGEQRIWFDCIVPVGTEFELVATVQTPEILEDAVLTNCATMQRQQQAVIANACSYIALNYMKNGDEATRQRAVYERILERLLSTEADKRGGAVQPDTWGMTNG